MHVIFYIGFEVLTAVKVKLLVFCVTTIHLLDRSDIPPEDGGRKFLRNIVNKILTTRCHNPKSKRCILVSINSFSSVQFFFLGLGETESTWYVGH
jgi:hypothetical protein